MAFRPLTQPPPTPLRDQPQITITRQGRIVLNTAAWNSIGQPAAVTISWDPTTGTIRLDAASPNTRHAHPLSERRLQLRAHPALNAIGYPYKTATVRYPAETTGPTALTARIASKTPGIPRPAGRLAEGNNA